MAGPYDYDGNDNVMLDVELLKTDVVVRRAEWTVLTMQGYTGLNQRTHGNRYHSDWNLTVPAEGATAIRATARLKDGTSTVKMSQIAVLVHAP